MSGLLDDPRSGDAGSVLLLGSGAIGSAISEALIHEGKVRVRPVEIPWSSNQRSEVLKRWGEVLPPAAEARNAIVWAAGRAGFSADQAECDEELAAFQDTLDAIGHLVAIRGPGSVSFHMLSSAGGLYEGLTRVSTGSAFMPRRPYGRLKMEAERRALGLASSIPVTIYRISSVYGCPKQGHRIGLIAQLVRNGLERRPSSLYGAMDTLRDYVGSDEVGRHIARGVTMERAIGLYTEMLVAGRPTTIGAVVDLVERALRRRVLVSFQEAWNARDITFDPAVRAAGFRSETLSTGVSRVAFQFLSSL